MAPLERLGERWGLHRVTAARAAAAMNEALEHLEVTARGGIDCRIEYDELTLSIAMRYEGASVHIPDERPDAQGLVDDADGVARMSLWIVKKLSDSVRVSTQGGMHTVHVVFEY